MLNKQNCINIGTATKTHGVGGELVVRPADGFDTDVFDADFLLLDLDGGLVPFPVESVRPKGPMQAIVKLEFCDSNEEAARLVGASVFIDSSRAEDALTDDDQIAVGMLVGFAAHEVDHGAIGTIVGLENIDDNNPLFVIGRPDGSEALIPIVDDFIASIDAENRVIEFALPEGLLDLE